MNRRDRRKLAAAQRTAKIIKGAGMVPTHWLWIGEAKNPPTFNKDQVADYVLNKKLLQRDGTSRFHIMKPDGSTVHFVAVLTEGDMVITICETEKIARDVYAKVKPTDATPI